MKKVISVFLAVLMLVTMFPLSVFAENTSGVLDSGYCGANGDNVTWTLFKDGELAIRGDGDMMNWNSIDDTPWKHLNLDIKKLTIGDYVTSIGTAAFSSCWNLSDVKIGNSVKLIGVGAFYQCSALSQLIIPNNVNIIGKYAFSYCGITKLVIGNSVTLIDDFAFQYCFNLQELEMGNNIKNIGQYAFDMTAIKKLFIPSSVEIIHWTSFARCVFEYITVDSNNKYYSNDDSGVLFNKDKSVLIKYPSKNMQTIYTIPDNTVSIESAAFLLAKFENVIIPNSVKIINSAAFLDCVNLTKILIPKNVEIIGDDAFSSCDNLEEICVDLNNRNYSSDEFGILFNKDKTVLKIYPTGNINSEYVVPDGVVSIVAYSFSDCYCLKTITIPTSVTYIDRLATSNWSPKNVIYCGTEEQWNAIENSTWFLSSETNINFNQTGSDSEESTIPDDNQPEKPVTPPESPDVQDNTPEISVTPFSVYFADYLKDYTSKITNVDMPCEALIAAGGMPSLTWNTVVESIKSLTNFKLGIDEKGYYEAILLDLLANTVTSVDYDKEMIETTVEMANMLTNYLVDKNVDVTKEKLDSLDLKNLQDNLQDYLTASNIQITKECFDALIDSTESTAECLDKISTYAITMQEGQHLVSALKLMAQHSDNQPLTDCLNELSTLMRATPEEMAKTVAKKGVAAKTSQVVGDYILGVIKNIFPLETIKDIINIADYGCNLIFPTSTSSEQMYRIYTLYHIEDVAKASFKTASNNYNTADTIANAENVVSCYDMIVRVYEHQIAECNALADLLYTKGLLNAVKNFFSTNSSYDYQNALDWVDSYNVDLDIIKSYKQSAYEERGLNLGLLQPVRFVGIADGKIMGYSEQFVETGASITVPNYSILKSNKFLNNLGTFEGWFYDSECTIPVWATSIQVNKPLVLYSKISTKNVKQLQIKCPVNVEIYDDNNNILLKIENDVLMQNSAEFVVVIEGTQKRVLLPSDENYNIKLIATDSGTMNYSVTEIENGTYVKRFNFYDVSLYNGQEFFGDIESGLNVAQSDYSLTTKTIENKTAEITPNEVIEKSEMQKLNISVNCVGNGIVSGNMLVTQGDYCVLEAIPNEDSDFDGWYCDNELLSLEKYFSFIVKENMSLTAVFVEDNAHEHTFGEWVIVKTPTATEEGSEERVCSVCGEKETRVIEKLNYLVGDANGDGKITAADARIILRISAKLDKVENYNIPFEAFDVIVDGKVNAADARKVLRISAKLE